MDVLLCTPSNTIIVILFYYCEECTGFVYLKFIMYNVKAAHCHRVSYNVQTKFYAEWVMF
jgi:hypothetical protein